MSGNSRQLSTIATQEELQNPPVPRLHGWVFWALFLDFLKEQLPTEADSIQRIYDTFEAMVDAGEFKQEWMQKVEERAAQWRPRGVEEGPLDAYMRRARGG